VIAGSATEFGELTVDETDKWQGDEVCGHQARMMRLARLI
jgi:hypothetical protein